MTLSSNFFGVVLFLFSSLVTGPTFMSKSLLALESWQFPIIRDWPKIWKLEIPPSEFCPISRLGRVRNTKCGMNVSNKMLLNAAKCQDYSFYRFWVVNGKPTGGGEGITPPLPPTLTQIRVNFCTLFVLVMFLETLFAISAKIHLLYVKLLSNAFDNKYQLKQSIQ